MRTRKTDSPKPGPGKKATQAKKDAAAADKTPDTAPKSAPKSTAKTSSTKSARVRQSTPATAITTPEPKPETEVETKEIHTSVEEIEKKGQAASKSPLGGKASSSPKLEETTENSPNQINEDVKDVLKSCTNSVSIDDQTEIDNLLDKNNEENNSAEVPKFEAIDAGEKLEVGEPGLELKQDNSDQVKNVKAEIDSEVNDETEARPIDDDDREVIEDVNDNSDGNNEEDAYEEHHMEEETGEEIVSAEAGEGDGDGGAVEGGAGDEEGAKMEEDEQIQISDMAKERKIKKEHEIFVGGLDRDAVEEDLKKAFEKVGEVVEVRLHKDYATNKNKGFAFVRFANKEQVARALEEMKNPLIRGKRCGIAPSEDNDTLFLGNICNTWTKDAIKRKLKDYGIDTVETVTLVPDTQNEGLSRGFAFLEFACHADAMAAYKRLQKPDVIFGHTERTAKVAFGEPLREPDPEVMAQVKSVFIDGLPPYWDEDQVKDHFKSYGEIERVVLARNMSTAKRKDFGFVNFASHEAAVACVNGVNDTELGDGKSKMKARARLANPLPKTQAVKGGMSGGFRIGHTGTGAFSRFGRGFGRGRFPSNRAGLQGGRAGFQGVRAGFQGGRAGFQGGRGFHPRGRGSRGGRFPYATDDVEVSYPEFRGWRPYGVRGRRGSTPGRVGAFDRGRGRGFSSRRPPFLPEGGFSGRFGVPQDSESHYYGRGRGVKRPFSMMEHDPSYVEPPSRLRPRYDLSDPLPTGSRYLDSSGSRLYSRDYYGPDYGDSSYSSYYGESSDGGYYY